MKCIFVILLTAAATFAADFTTGQAARLVIGQQTFTAQDPASSDSTVGGVSGLAYAAGYLFVADSNRVGAAPSNNRILLFPAAQFPNPAAQLDYTRKCPACLGTASVVMGRKDFTPFDITVEPLPPPTQTSLRLPTAVASDGVHVIVADTDHNRVLIWNSIPNVNNAPANVVIGQASFTTAGLPGNTPNSKSMRGPQGVWILNGKLYVADTQNNRVLIYNQIPTQNGAAADVVLGQKDFTTFIEPDLTQQKSDATAANMLNPVAVTSDGQRLFVTDLGYNRVLIWNSIPTSNAQPADAAVGQPNLTSSLPNNSYSVDPNDTTFKQTPVLCTTSNGTDTNSNPIYPSFCNSTLSFPRYALSTGDRLFIADGGNDRVLVYNHIPKTNGEAADYVIGQLGGSINQASDAADSLRTPMSLAWDGTSLYVSDAYNRRITVYSPGANNIPYTGVRNAASLDIVALGSVTLTGDIQADDTVTVTINATDYTYKVLAKDTLDTVLDGIIGVITASNSGAGDPSVFVSPEHNTESVLLRARVSGTDGNNITYSAKTTAAASATAAKLTATALGANLAGGGDAAQIAPGTVVSILGDNLTFQTAAADLNANSLPNSLGGTEVYFNGIKAPLFYVSPTQINAQVPWELSDTTSVNAYVRAVREDGNVVVTTPVAVSIVPANPGIFADLSTTPATGKLYHANSNASAIVSVDGSVTANDIATVTIEDRPYSYTITATDTLDTIRDGLVALINQDPKVTAASAGVFDRIIIKARVQGPDGNGIAIGGSSSTTTGATQAVGLIVTAFNVTTCCANVAGSPVTIDNPAVPGEMLYLYATGLGVPSDLDVFISELATGQKFPKGGRNTVPGESVSSIAGGKTADVISATVAPGLVGAFYVLLHLNSDIPTDPATQLTIAQDIYVSNVVTFPVLNPNPPQ
jgi:sugar lactone lactonase YvrE